MKRLDLVVGPPNGAGKSTFVELTLAPLLPGSAFVNADEIAKRRWPDDPAAHSYEAARIAATTRSALIARGDSFIAETVFSHPSKLELITEAATAGYVVALHILIIPEELAVHRVRLRVSAGGHSVPEDKIRERTGGCGPWSRGPPESPTTPPCTTIRPSGGATCRGTDQFRLADRTTRLAGLGRRRVDAPVAAVIAARLCHPAHVCGGFADGHLAVTDHRP